MQAPDPIEIILARLMPPPLSDEVQSEMEVMFDELSSGHHESMEHVGDQLAPRFSYRWLVGGGIAAAGVGLLAIAPIFRQAASFPIASAVHTSAGFVLLSESDRIESMSDEGWHESLEGMAMRAFRVNAVAENRVRDEESGIVVKLSELREELVLTPISAF